MLVGLLKPTSGSIKILEQDGTGDKPSIRQKMGYLSELPSYPKHLSGNELLDVYGRMYGMSKDARRKKIPDLIKKVGLEGRGKDRIGGYSKGMQQRIGMAQAMINDPEMLILDEPSMGLDPVGVVEMRKLVKGIAKSGTTIFFSSHILSEVTQICDRITIMNEGLTVASGTLDEISELSSASRRIVVEVDKTSDKVLRALQDLKVAKVELKGKRYTLSLDQNKKDVRPIISKAVTNSGGVIIEMHEEGKGLEDAFLDLLGKGS
jgi:ABC-2 type transport system ATP-binding protein